MIKGSGRVNKQFINFPLIWYDDMGKKIMPNSAGYPLKVLDTVKMLSFSMMESYLGFQKLWWNNFFSTGDFHRTNPFNPWFSISNIHIKNKMQIYKSFVEAYNRGFIIEKQLPHWIMKTSNVHYPFFPSMNPIINFLNWRFSVNHDIVGGLSAKQWWNPYKWGCFSNVISLLGSHIHNQ